MRCECVAALIGPGFFSNAPVQTALIVGAVVAIAAAVTGTFTVMRGQSFAGHSLADIGTAGGSAAFLVGVSPLYGFIAMNCIAAAAMEAAGVRDGKGRDIATGTVLGFALGLAALFLYLDTTSTNTTGAAVNVLFGSIFTLPTTLVPIISALSAAGLIATLALYRPLLLSSVSADLAAVRGVRLRVVAGIYVVTLALAVSLSAVTIGAILSTALLIGPAATALQLTARTGRAIALAAAIGVISVWAGILLSYDSDTWFAGHSGLPASFSVVAVILAFYAVARITGPRVTRRVAPTRQEA